MSRTHFELQKEIPFGALVCELSEGEAGKLLAVAVSRTYLTGSVSKIAAVTTDQRQTL